MRIVLSSVVVLATLAACGGGSGSDDPGIKVFKSMGTLQCNGGGVTLAAMQAQLTSANVQVGSAACGTSGLAVPATCGTPDGKIGIFEISSAHAGAAATAGFANLTTLPLAKTIPCG